MFTQILQFHKFRTVTSTRTKNPGCLISYLGLDIQSINRPILLGEISFPSFPFVYMVMTVFPALFCSGRSLGSWKENVCYQTLWILWQEISELIGEYWNTIAFIINDHDKLRGCLSPHLALIQNNLDLVQLINIRIFQYFILSSLFFFSAILYPADWHSYGCHCNICECLRW